MGSSSLKTSTKTGRLHIRLPEDLKEGIQQYAANKNTTVSSLVTRFFTALLEEGSKKTSVDAEQV